MTPWLLLDYGDVISLPYAEGALPEIADLLGAHPDQAATAYAAHRPAYDAGGDAQDYWEQVAGHPLAPDLVDRLVDADMRGWGHIDPDLLVLLDEQLAAGVRLALLSNAPHAQADAFDPGSCRRASRAAERGPAAGASEGLAAATARVIGHGRAPRRRRAAQATGVGLRAAERLHRTAPTAQRRRS